MRIQLTTVGPGMPAVATAGDSVSYTLPEGFVLRRVVDGITEDVSTPSPFVHGTPDAIYRVDRVASNGVPLTAELYITAPD